MKIPPVNCSKAWPNGAACPHCGGAHRYRLTPKVTSKAPCRNGSIEAAAHQIAALNESEAALNGTPLSPVEFVDAVKQVL